MTDRNQSGQALIAVMFFLFLISAYSVIFVLELMQSTRIERTEENQIRARWIAEAGLEKAVWCLNNNDDAACGGASLNEYTGEAGIQVASGEFTTTVEVLNESQILVTSTGSTAGENAQIKQIIGQGAVLSDIEYYSSIVSGIGGVEMIGNASIAGDIYANGPVICTAGSIDNDITISENNYLDGCPVGGSVWAHEIRNAAVSGDAHYQVLLNSTVNGTTYPGSPDPDYVPPLIDQEVIDEWKIIAANGDVIEGDYAISSDQSLGPVRINGNLTINSSRTLTLTGTVYVTGSILMRANGVVKLHDDFGTNGGVLMSDGAITVNASGTFTSSAAGGIILLTTASNSENAINLKSAIAQSGNYLGLYAPNGTIQLGGGNKVLQVSANKIVMDNGAQIDFTENILSFSIVSDVTLGYVWEAADATRIE